MIVESMKQGRRNLEILFNNTTIVPFKILGKYRCFFCDVKLEDRQQLKDHNQIHLPCSTNDNSLKALRMKDCKVNVDVSEVKCKVCSEQFNNIEDIGFHLTHKHSLPYDLNTIIPFGTFRLLDFKCVVCGKYLKNLRTLTVHMKDHTSHCNLCNRTFSSFALRFNHMKTEHNVSQGGTCGFCHKEFDSRASFLAHAGKCSAGDRSKIEVDEIVAEANMDTLKVVRKKNAFIFNNTTIIPFKFYHNRIQCFYCSEKFISCTDFRTHSTTEHFRCDAKTDLDKYPLQHLVKSDAMLIKVDSSLLECKICKSQFEDLKSLLAHLEIEHKAKLGNCADKFLPFKLVDDHYPCPQCGEEFTLFGNMFNHFNKVHNTSHRALCIYCGKSFHNENALKLHTFKHHTGQKRYKCNECDLAFIYKSKLKLHMGIAHNKKVFGCSHCNEMFSSQHAKMKHVSIKHNGGYKCIHCDASFIKHHTMTIHVRSVHLKEKNIKCTQCDSAFFDKSGLKRHMRIHTLRASDKK